MKNSMKELLKQNPHDLDVLVARLKFLDHVKFRKTRLPAVVMISKLSFSPAAL